MSGQRIVVAVAATLIVGGASLPTFAIELSPNDILSDWTQVAGARSGFIDASGWSLVGGELQGPTPGTTGGATGSGTIISDFTVAGDFSFSGRFRTTDTDDDIIGFVWGFQDLDNMFRFGWDAFDSGGGGFGDELGTNGFANEPAADAGGSFPNTVHGLRVLKEVATINTFFFQEALNSATPWQRNTLYDFTVGRSGDQHRVTIDQGSTNLLDETFVDAAFSSGRIGLHVDSQQSVFFSELTFVPEPTPSTLIGLGLLGMALRRHRR